MLEDWPAELDASARCLFLSDPPSGLRAVLVLDDLTLGPAAGGIRTRSYPSLRNAVRECSALARAMTMKCSIAGLDAGGGKLVVLDHPGLDRPRAFARLGELVEELGGLFRTAGDLGTTAADLHAMAANCRYVHADETGLAAAVARGLLRCIEACAEVQGHSLRSLSVGVQGAGAIGSAVTGALVAAGLRVYLADLDPKRAERVAREHGATVIEPAHLLKARLDLLAPCAVGGVIGADEARGLRVWAVCGAANNILSDDEAGAVLVERGIAFVPDPVASAGAVIAGLGRSVMGLPDPTPLIDALGQVARDILRESAASGEPTPALAARLAQRRLERVRARLRARAGK